MFNQQFSKYLAGLALAVFMAGAIAACGSPSTPAAEAPAPAPTEAPPAAVATEAPPAATEAATEAAAEQSGAAAPAAALRTFRIVSEGSEARFILDEQLMGQPKTVVGVTKLVQGELQLDPANPAATQIGPIQIDARDFKTDNDRRNGAIQRFILQSADDKNRYITFTPTAIAGLPETVTIGTPFEFTVTGDLQIRDVVRSETFQVAVTANSENELVGTASTVVMRGNYGLNIPSVPSVANVTEEVKLEFDFTATAAN
jgi:polyisoprenoid-binding protein YceI